MKLVYISNSRLPTNLAHGLQVMQMCSAFVKNGWEVELWVPRRIEEEQDPFNYYGIKKNFLIKKIFCLDFFPWFMGSRTAFFIQLYSFLLISRLRLLFSSYDLLYSREPAAGIFFSGVVLEVHSLSRGGGNFYLLAMKRARALVVLTSFIKERLAKLGIAPDKILVAPDAVDLEKFNINLTKDECRKKLDLPLDKKIIGYAGMLKTLGMEKGIDTAIGALADLKNRRDILMVLVGGHEDDIKFYKNEAKIRNLEDRIIFVGMVKHDLIPLYLKAFDVLIAPFPENEHYNFYMSPLKVFEYMASGRPIITTNLPSLKEIFDNHNSVLISPDSSLELAAAIIKIFENRDFSEDLAAQALIDVKKYTWQKRVESILAFINGISKNHITEIGQENIRSFSSELSVKEYSKKYLRPGEEYVIKKYMPAGSRVLDVGCGAGRTTYYIFENGCRVIGVDISLPLIEQAKKDYPSIDFRAMDARKLDFKDNSFDAAFFSFNGIDNLPSLEERENAIKEMKRILRPGGVLIYSSHNSLCIPRTKNSRRILLNNIGKLRIGPHWRIERYDFGKVTQYYNNLWGEKKSLLRLGFKDVKIIGNGRKLLIAPEFLLAFLDKFPIYIAKK